jgi:hypothetical protein
VENDVEILKALAFNGDLTTWDITQHVLSQLGRETTTKEHRAYYSIIFRRVKDLIHTGHLELARRISSEKNMSKILYRLGLPGSLAVYLMGVSDDDQMKLIDNSLHQNPISYIADGLLERSFEHHVIKKEFIEPIRIALKRGINVDVVTYDWLLQMLPCILYSEVLPTSDAKKQKGSMHDHIDFLIGEISSKHSQGA